MNGRLAFLIGCACGSTLAVAGCGSQRSADAAFQAHANRICREVHRQSRSVDFSSTSGFARGLAGMQAGVERLARLHPLPSDEPAYGDLLAKLRDINARLDANEATLLRLQHRLKESSGRSATRTIRRFRALVSPVESDGLRAAADARALGLGACATDLSGGAPLPSGGRRA
jgi:hypothetical protein